MLIATYHLVLEDGRGLLEFLLVVLPLCYNPIYLFFIQKLELKSTSTIVTWMSFWLSKFIAISGPKEYLIASLQ